MIVSLFNTCICKRKKERRWLHVGSSLTTETNIYYRKTNKKDDLFILKQLPDIDSKAKQNGMCVNLYVTCVTTHHIVDITDGRFIKFKKGNYISRIQSLNEEVPFKEEAE